MARAMPAISKYATDRNPKSDKRVEYLNTKESTTLCQRSNFIKRAQTAYILDLTGDGIFYSILFTYYTFFPT